MSALDNISIKINSGVIEKKEYFDFLRIGDGEILKFLKDAKYVYPKDRVSLFNATEDERLAEIKAKNEMIEKNPEVAISEYAKYVNDVMHNFLTKYHIGFCHDIRLCNNGTINMEIVCSIHTPFCDNNPAASKINFQRQLKTLSDIGFVLEKDRHGIDDMVLADVEKNHVLLKKLLSNNGAKLIKITTREDAIYKVEFFVKYCDIDKFDEDVETVVFEIGDVLNEDEILKVKKLLKETQSAITYLAQNLSKHNCGALIESYYAEICEIFGYDGVIRQIVDERHAEARQKNKLIAEMENSVGTMFPPEKAKEIVNKVFDKLSAFTVNNLGFDVGDFYIDGYGYVNAKLRFVGYYYWGDFEIFSEDNLKRTFNCTEGTRDNETLFIIDDSENKKKIFEFLKKSIPSINVRDVEVRVRGEEFVIQNISISVRNVLSIFNLPDGKKSRE